MKTTVTMEEADIRAAVTEHLMRKGYAVGVVRVIARHDPGDGPMHGPSTTVRVEAEVTPEPRHRATGGVSTGDR